MPRPRSPNRDKAMQLWLKSGKTRHLKDIAEELQVSEEQVRKWKNQDKWDKVTLPNENSNVTNHKGGQPGNRNAAGNKGGAAPEKNKNALKTGEFETLFFDTMDPDELQIIRMVYPDKEQLLLQEIQLLTIRERRMLKRIDAIKESVEYLDDGQVVDGFTVTKIKRGIEKGELTDLKEYEGKIGQMQAIEDALTRVQARKQAAINSLHRYGMDDAKLQMDLMKLDLTIMKSDGRDTKVDNDGFLDALDAKAEQLWGGGNEP